jgi:hypothetical protein
MILDYDNDLFHLIKFTSSPQNNNQFQVMASGRIPLYCHDVRGSEQYLQVDMAWDLGQ